MFKDKVEKIKTRLQELHIDKYQCQESENIIGIVFLEESYPLKYLEIENDAVTIFTTKPILFSEICQMFDLKQYYNVDNSVMNKLITKLMNVEISTMYFSSSESNREKYGNVDFTLCSLASDFDNNINVTISNGNYVLRFRSQNNITPFLENMVWFLNKKLHKGYIQKDAISDSSLQQLRTFSDSCPYPVILFNQDTTVEGATVINDNGINITMFAYKL